jgi:hypothetical protein
VAPKRTFRLKGKPLTPQIVPHGAKKDLPSHQGIQEIIHSLRVILPSLRIILHSFSMILHSLRVTLHGFSECDSPRYQRDLPQQGCMGLNGIRG